MCIIKWKPLLLGYFVGLIILFGSEIVNASCTGACYDKFFGNAPGHSAAVTTPGVSDQYLPDVYYQNQLDAQYQKDHSMEMESLRMKELGADLIYNEYLRSGGAYE